MSDLVRLSFSIEKSLLNRLEELIKSSRYHNRSEYIRDMIRGRVVQQQWQRNEEALGTVTLLYDHHARGLDSRLNQLQHEHHGAILASTHIHLDRQICAEMIMIRGRASQIKHIHDKLAQQKGVLYTSLSINSTGKKLIPRHHH